MRRELDEQLCKLAPHLFADRHGEMRTTALCWGFECGDGWYELLKDAALKLEPLCKVDYDRNVRFEKSWYKYVRRVLFKTARIRPLFTLLWWLANKLLPNLNNAFYWYGGGPRASQVKEKYGTLRFYLTHGTEEMYAIIDEAERQSSITCETCGKPGKVCGEGWYYTRCTSCWKKMREERE